MSRWTTLTFTTPEVLPGVPLEYDYALPASVIDFHSITITSSVARGGCSVEIYPTSARNTDPVYSTGSWITTFTDPRPPIGYPAEQLSPWKFCYSDDDVGAELHLTLHGDGQAKTFTFSMEYELPSYITNYEEFSVKSYGAIGDGTTDDTVAIGLASVAAIAAGGVLFFPPGTYKHTSTLDFTGAKVFIKGYGATLYFTGAGVCVTCNAAATFERYEWDVSGLTIRGNATATKGMVLTKVNHGTFKDLSFQDVTTTGLELGNTVCNRLENIRVSNNERAFVTTPATGILLGATASANTFINPIVEGVTGSGILIEGGINNTIIGGTSEGNAKGVEIHLGNGNTIQGIDCEANTTYDFEVSSSFNRLVNCIGASAGATASLVVKQAAGHAVPYLNSISGCDLDIIDIQATAYCTSLVSCCYAILGGAGTLTNSGNATRIINVISAASGVNVEELVGGLNIKNALNHDGTTVGFYGTAPVVQGAAVADATDAPSAITQLNLLLARIRAVGLIAT